MNDPTPLQAVSPDPHPCVECGKPSGCYAAADDGGGSGSPKTYICKSCCEDEGEDPDDYDDSMDGDHASALASCGWGTDEDYGSFGGDE